MYNNIQNEFWKWNPATNQWSQLSRPDIDLKMGLGNGGFEINNKIYFSPVLKNTFSFSNYQTEINDTYSVSYDPGLNQWRKEILAEVDTSISPVNYCSFVYNNKLYSFIREVNEESEAYRIVLKAFNPVDLSWKRVLDSVPFNGACGCRALVINNIIYLLPSFVLKNEYATDYFRNELYTFDLDKLVFNKKSIWDHNELTGVDNAYLFEYNGRLNLYGGEFGRGYFNYLISNSYEYDANIDKWIPFRDYFGDDVLGMCAPRNGGFAYKVNDKIFIGIGYDNRMTDIYSNIYEYYLD